MGKGSIYAWGRVYKITIERAQGCGNRLSPYFLFHTLLIISSHSLCLCLNDSLNTGGATFIETART